MEDQEEVLLRTDKKGQWLIEDDSSCVVDSHQKSPVFRQGASKASNSIGKVHVREALHGETLMIQGGVGVQQMVPDNNGKARKIGD